MSVSVAAPRCLLADDLSRYARKCRRKDDTIKRRGITSAGKRIAAMLEQFIFTGNLRLEQQWRRYGVHVDSYCSAVVFVRENSSSFCFYGKRKALMGKHVTHDSTLICLPLSFSLQFLYTHSHRNLFAHFASKWLLIALSFHSNSVCRY